ncbi:MAG0110 family membrane protein [Mycoplasma sp. 394]
MNDINLNASGIEIDINIERKKKAKLWGISLAVLGFSFAFVITISLVIQYFLRRNNNPQIALIMLWVGLAALFVLSLVSGFLYKIKSKFIYFYYLFQLGTWILIFTGILFFFLQVYKLDTVRFLGISLLPILIIGVFGLIGYFEVIKIKFLYAFIGVLSIALIVMFFISIFVFGITWYYSAVAIVLIAAMTAADIYQVRKELNYVVYTDSNFQFKYALSVGIRLFVNAASILLQLLMLIMGASKK